MSDSVQTLTTFETPVQRGVRRFGYSPDGDCEKSLGITNRCIAAFRANREAVNAAKQQPVDGDWKFTRAVLRVISPLARVTRTPDG